MTFLCSAGIARRAKTGVVHLHRKDLKREENGSDGTATRKLRLLLEHGASCVNIGNHN